MTKTEFINKVASYVQLYAPKYDIECYSPIIAQAVLESGYGKSLLGVKNNFFGLKCGRGWNGKSISLKTMEEYKVGTKTQITDNFRVYDTMSEGIKGYFDFINTARYKNLKHVTDPTEYLTLIKKDGYATSSTYVKDLSNVIRNLGLTKYDAKADKTLERVAHNVIDGLYGIGSTRKLLLEKEGFNYKVVQKRVNEILKVHKK